MRFEGRVVAIHELPRRVLLGNPKVLEGKKEGRKCARPAFGLLRTLFIYFVSSEEEVPLIHRALSLGYDAASLG